MVPEHLLTELTYSFSSYTLAILLDNACHDENILWKAGHTTLSLMPGLLISSRLACSLSGGVACHSSLRGLGDGDLQWLWELLLVKTTWFCFSESLSTLGSVRSITATVSWILLWFWILMHLFVLIVFLRFSNFVSLQHFSCFAADAWVIFTSSFESQLRS